MWNLKMQNLIISLFIAQLLAHSAVCSLDTNPIKTLDYGTFKGFYDAQTDTDNWLGMPFATGGRLENPAVISSENKLDGIQDVTKYGPACPQTQLIASPTSGDNAQLGAVLSFLEQVVYQNISNQAEDCLSINVQVPHGLDSTVGFPVMMWIFGGGFELGSSAALGSELTTFQGVIYQGANIVKRSMEMGQPIVFVSANYRINAFGGLASREVTDAGLSNLALKDQRVAMRWVQKYINAFGGDSTKVTLIGESAGAWSIATHIVLNGGDPEGLFRAAIMLSGGPPKWDSYQRGQHTFDAVMRSIGCDIATDKITCFRATPYEAIYRAVQECPNFFAYESLSIPWYPRPDGKYLPESPDILVAKGKAANIPYIIGDMVDEGTIFSLTNQRNVTTNTEFIKYFQTVFFPNGNRSIVEELCNMYSEDPSESSPFGTGVLNQLGPQYKRLAAAIGDLSFQAPRRDLLAHTSDRQNAWSYQIQDSNLLVGRVTGGSALSDFPIVGSFHASDVALYVFGTIPPAVSKNSRNIMSTFISFVNHLDPNAHGLDDLPLWPRFKSTSKILYRFKENGPDLIQDTFREEQMAFINAHRDDFRF